VWHEDKGGFPEKWRLFFVFPDFDWALSVTEFDGQLYTRNKNTRLAPKDMTTYIHPIK